MITGWLNDGGKYYYLNPADGKMIANGSFVVNNVNYTFNQSGVCLSETSAIDGGSAGSVYTPGTAGTVANGNYMGTPAAGNAQNGITTGNSGSGNAAVGSAPGGSTTTATGATTAESSQTNTGMSAGNYQTGRTGNFKQCIYFHFQQRNKYLRQLPDRRSGILQQQLRFRKLQLWLCINYSAGRQYSRQQEQLLYRHRQRDRTGKRQCVL